MTMDVRPTREAPAEPRAMHADGTAGARGPTARSLRAPRWATIGIFLILVGAVAHIAQSFILPVLLAFLFTLVLSPIVRFFQRKHVPASITAGVLVALAVALLLAGFYSLSGPAREWLADAPEIGREVERKLSSIVRPLKTVAEAGDRVNVGTGSDETVQEVVIREPGLVTSVAASAPNVIASFAFGLVLLLFMLASGDLFYEKLVKVMPTLSDKKNALRIAHDIERELSRYLFTITLINIALGVVIASGLALLGMPNPILFGAMATLFNFIPYVGAIGGAVITAVVSLLSFESTIHALYPPLLYFACTTIEGQLVTPNIVGRRLEMNAVVVFFSVALFGWMWGFVGMFVAVPILVALKTFCHRIPALENLGAFLEARDHERPAERQGTIETTKG